MYCYKDFLGTMITVCVAPHLLSYVEFTHTCSSQNRREPDASGYCNYLFHVQDLLFHSSALLMRKLEQE